MGGEGWGAKGMLAPLSNYWGRGYPPPPTHSYACEKGGKNERGRAATPRKCIHLALTQWVYNTDTVGYFVIVHLLLEDPAVNIPELAKACRMNICIHQCKVYAPFKNHCSQLSISQKSKFISRYKI